jgi:DNA adenine methylase
MEFSTTLVRPVKPAAGYIGGKRNLSRRLVGIIDAIEHRTYAEPFVGMGGIFLRRTRKPAAEVINDISGDVVTFFRILQRHYVAFMDELKWRYTSRAEFDRLMRVDASTLTDLERAARFLYLQRTAFGGKVSGRNYGVDASSPGRFNVAQLQATLEDLHDRLAGVAIEQLPYGQFIKRYDRQGTLFYLDPPYFRCEDDYGPGVFGPDDFQLLADQLAAIAGRFILSINDAPEIREIFSRFSIEAVEVTYQIGAKHTRAGELIISS